MPNEVKNIECDIAIIGASLGGIAAALAAAREGETVILTDEYAWIGGQVTSQAVAALDEYRGIESLPPTRSYGEFRGTVRRAYAQAYEVPPGLEPPNPGNGWVSRLCFEPKVGLQVLQEMLAPFVQSGRLRILTRCCPTACLGTPEHIQAVELVSARGQHLRVRAATFLDATDQGDLLPLAGLPYASGAEAQEDTLEPHASPDGAHPERVQSFTVCFLCEFRPGESHIIPRPRGYERFKRQQPYSLTLVNHKNQSVPYNFFTATDERPLSFWTYRRSFDAASFHNSDHPNDIALINWPSNDYRWGSLIDQTPERKAAVLDEARRLSLGFLYWLQTEAPRDDGQGPGYPELKLLPAAVGTRSGLAQAPYVRESRRILGLYRIREQDITVAANPGKVQAAFYDSVGIGSYAMDLHACVGDEHTMFAATLPFQIPLGALIPQDCANLLAACKNIATTHLTNGSYRLHPVEWAIGEAAGTLAAFCRRRSCSPASLRANPELLGDFQAHLRSRGVNLAWPEHGLPEDKAS